MSEYNKQQVAVLSEVIKALTDGKVKGRVATLYRGTGDAERISRGGFAANADLGDSESWNLDGGINIRRLYDQNGNMSFVVRTPNGEAQFKSSQTGDFHYVMGAVFSKIGNRPNADSLISEQLLKVENKELSALAKERLLNGYQRSSDRDKSAKFMRAKEALMNMGVEKTPHVDQWLKNKGYEK